MGKLAKTKVLVDIVAECSTHGRFQVRRKPNKTPSTSASEGDTVSGFYCAVVCPTCRMWGTIITQTMVTEVKTS